MQQEVCIIVAALIVSHLERTMLTFCSGDGSLAVEAVGSHCEQDLSSDAAPVAFRLVPLQNSSSVFTVHLLGKKYRHVLSHCLCLYGD